MSYPTRRARLEAEKAAALALRSQRSKKLSLGIVGVATAASASFFSMTPADASLDDVPAPAASQASPATTSSSNGSTASGTYTVQAGDTLSAIANDQGVSLSGLMDANGLSAASTIYPGEELKLSGSSSSSSSTQNSSSSSAPSTGSSSSVQNSGSSSSSQSDSQGSAQATASTDSGQQASVSTASATDSKAAVVDKALEIVNSDATYRWGATGPSQYDCSGLTQVAFAAAGIELPRVTSDQYAEAKSYVSLDNLQSGDLVFWSNNGSSSGIYHVAIYIGDGKIAQARNPQAGITVNSLSEYSEYNPPLNTAARY